MKLGTILAIAIPSLTIATGVGMNISYHNKAVRMEANIKKLDMASESLLSNGTMAILEKAKVKDSYAADFKEVLRGSIGARSDNEKGLAMKWVREQNPQLDNKIYMDLSAYIEGMRSDFHLSRNRLMDACATYEVAINSAVSGFFISFNGFPKMNLDSRCKVITDTKTRSAFSTGVQTTIL